jgi:hypothetical protein
VSRAAGQPRAPVASRWRLAVAGLGLLTVLTACGSGTSGGAVSSATSTPTTRAVGTSLACAGVTALRAAVTNIRNIHVNATIETQVSADLTKIGKALARLKGEASSRYPAQTSQLVDALKVLAEEAKLLLADPSAAIVKVTKTAVSELKTAATSVAARMRLACPP